DFAMTRACRVTEIASQMRFQVQAQGFAAQCIERQALLAELGCERVKGFAELRREQRRPRKCPLSCLKVGEQRHGHSRLLRNGRRYLLSDEPSPVRGRTDHAERLKA